MFKKLMLLTASALMAIALAAPVSASASGTLFHDGVPIPTGEHITIDLVGHLITNLNPIGSTFGCNAHSELTLKSGHPSHGTGTFDVTTDKCTGTGFFAGCTVESHTTNAPFTVDVTSQSVLFTNVEIEYDLDDGCLVPRLILTLGQMTALSGSESMASFSLSGEGFDDVTGLPFETEGTMEVTGESNGTYQFG
jgi:hypothetical protein